MHESSFLSILQIGIQIQKLEPAVIGQTNTISSMIGRSKMTSKNQSMLNFVNKTSCDDINSLSKPSTEVENVKTSEKTSILNNQVSPHRSDQKNIKCKEFESNQSEVERQSRISQSKNRNEEIESNQSEDLIQDRIGQSRTDNESETSKMNQSGVGNQRAVDLWPEKKSRENLMEDIGRYDFMLVLFTED